MEVGKMLHKIDWTLIGQAIPFYENLGFQYIELPWLVSDEAIKATFNGHFLECFFQKNYEGAAVGSAEQAFIQKMLDKDISQRKYLAAGPCFRPADKEDKLHQKTFFKVEFIHILSEKNNTAVELNRCIDCAYMFFNSHLGFNINVEKPVDRVTDITLNGIEIGSYGYREYKEHKWIYGTGIAEPRFSIARASKNV